MNQFFKGLKECLENALSHIQGDLSLKSEWIEISDSLQESKKDQSFLKDRGSYSTDL